MSLTNRGLRSQLWSLLKKVLGLIFRPLKTSFCSTTWRAITQTMREPLGTITRTIFTQEAIFWSLIQDKGMISFIFYGLKFRFAVKLVFCCVWKTSFLFNLQKIIYSSTQVIQFVDLCSLLFSSIIFAPCSRCGLITLHINYNIKISKIQIL